MKRVVSAYPLINRIKEKQNKILDYGWDLYIDNRKKNSKKDLYCLRFL